MMMLADPVSIEVTMGTIHNTMMSAPQHNTKREVKENLLPCLKKKTYENYSERKRIREREREREKERERERERVREGEKIHNILARPSKHKS